MIENSTVFHSFSTLTDNYYQFKKVFWDHADAYIITLATHIDTQLCEQEFDFGHIKMTVQTVSPKYKDLDVCGFSTLEYHGI